MKTRKLSNYDIQEIAGILGMLSEDKYQSLVSQKRAAELRKKLLRLI